MVELPSEFRSRPRSYYLWSRSRRAGHVLAFALGGFADPSFRWLSVRTSSAPPGEDEAWSPRLLPSVRVLAPLSTEDLRPGRPVSRETFDSLIRTERASEERTALEHYLRLPPRLQEMLDRPVASGGGPRVLVVANSDRIRQLRPIDPNRLRPFTQLFSFYGLSIVATSVPPPYEGRYGFDVVLRVDVDTESEWRSGRIVVEKGLGSGEFRTGATLRLEELSGYLASGALIERALP
jgi:hypothetical protein